MKDKLKLENYETIFFKMLEDEYSAADKSNYLKQIEADAFFSFEWENWQKALLVDESADLAIEHKSFFDGIKAEADLMVPPQKRRILPFYFWSASVAALFVVVLSIILFWGKNPNKSGITGIENVERDSIGVESYDLIENNIANTKSEYLEIDRIKTKKLDTLVKQPFAEINNPNFKSQKPIFPIIKVNEKFDLGGSALADFSPTIIDNPVYQTIEPIPDDQTDSTLTPFKRNFIVSISDVKKEDIILTVNDLEDQRVNMVKLLEDRKISVVRRNNQLFVKLESENTTPVLLALEIYLKNY